MWKPGLRYLPTSQSVIFEYAFLEFTPRSERRDWFQAGGETRRGKSISIQGLVLRAHTGTSHPLVRTRLNEKSSQSLPSPSLWAKLGPEDKEKEGLQSLWVHHTYLWGHPFVFLMYLLCCYIFHSFPFLHKKHKYFLVLSNFFNTEVCGVKLWKVSFTALPNPTSLPKETASLFLRDLFPSLPCLCTCAYGHTHRGAVLQFLYRWYLVLLPAFCTQLSVLIDPLHLLSWLNIIP